MINTIVAFGDSWVYGDELVERMDGQSREQNSIMGFTSSWKIRNQINLTGKIKKHYNIHTINYGVNGGSNEEILFQLLSYIKSKNYDPDNLVLIGLTSPIRNFHWNNTTKSGWKTPSWSLESFLGWGPKELTSDRDYRTWWELNVKYNINGRNDILTYIKNTLSLKAILDIHCKNYIVWQSIDGDMYDYVEDDYDNILLHHYTDTEETHHEPMDYLFEKTYLDKLLKNNTTQTQIWLNTNKPCWRGWLMKNHSDKDVFFKANFHPTELGIELWFNEFLKYYIDSIFVELNKEKI